MVISILKNKVVSDLTFQNMISESCLLSCRLVRGTGGEIRVIDLVFFYLDVIIILNCGRR